MLKNFYQYLLAKASRVFPCLDMKCRLKRSICSFIVVPAKWVYVTRQWILTYTRRTDGCTTGQYSIQNLSDTDIFVINHFNPRSGGKGEYALINAIQAHLMFQSDKISHKIDFDATAWKIIAWLRN